MSTAYRYRLCPKEEMEYAHEPSLEDAPIDFGDDCSVNDESMARIGNYLDIIDLEDKYLRQIFLPEPNTINIPSLHKSKEFMRLYCFDNKGCKVVQGNTYVKRGYILCKGYRKYLCKCSVGYKLVQNYNEKAANYESRADDGGITENSVYTPIWKVDTTSRTNCFEHTSSCTYRRINLGDISCSKWLNSARELEDAYDDSFWHEWNALAKKAFEIGRERAVPISLMRSCLNELYSKVSSFEREHDDHSNSNSGSTTNATETSLTLTPCRKRANSTNEASSEDILEKQRKVNPPLIIEAIREMDQLIEKSYPHSGMVGI